MSDYAIVIESTRTGFSAYSPDLPGCIATGQTEAEARERMAEAIDQHLQGLRKAGVEPPPSSA